MVTISLPHKSTIIFIILALTGLSAGGYFFYQYQKTQAELQTIKTDPTTVQKAAQEEVKRLIAEVGKLIELPTGEEPTVATITDLEKLKDQPFFQKAKNGDKVLIYTNAKKAILYDPLSKKILDIAPVNIGSMSAATAQNIKIILRNGTTITGLTSKAEPKIKLFLPEATISAKENAANNDYQQSVLVVLNNSFKAQAEKLAKDLNIKVSTLPSEEKSGDGVDLIIILGKDIANSL